MRPHPTTWVMLEVGMYLRAAGGMVWRVDGKTYADGKWTMRITNAANEFLDVARGPDDKVTLMVPTHEDAEALLVAAGMVTSERIVRKFLRVEDYSTKNSKWTRASLAGHLFNHHGISISPTAHAENGSMTDLLEAHALAHASRRPMILPHVHVPSEELL